MKKAAARDPNASFEITIPLLCRDGQRTVHAELLTETIWVTDWKDKETEMEKRHEPRLLHGLCAEWTAADDAAQSAAETAAEIAAERAAEVRAIEDAAIEKELAAEREIYHTWHPSYTRPSRWDNTSDDEGEGEAEECEEAETEDDAEDDTEEESAEEESAEEASAADESADESAEEN